MLHVVYAGLRCSKCDGEITFCRLVDKNGGKHFRLWCEPCNKLHHRSVTAEMRTPYGLVPSNWDQLSLYLTLAERGLKVKYKAEKDVDTLAKAFPAHRLVAPPLRGETVAALKRLPYKEYLKSNHWKQLRHLACLSAGWRCQLCNRMVPVSVHHRTYERRGEERLGDLTVLCQDCHAKFHDILPKE